MIRLGIVGARRARQGLGPFLARFAEQSGARVSAFCGRDPARLASTAAELGDLLGHPVRGHPSACAMLSSEAARGEPLRAVLIASPIETHPQALADALAGGVDVLCEKPLLWTGSGSAERAEREARAFERAGLRLWVNAQWPYTLAGYFALFPELRGQIPSTFEMHLCPRSRGSAMLIDSLTHPLSLLQTLAPAEDPRLEQPRIALTAPDESALRCSFHWCAAGARISCAVFLSQRLEAPRPAAYGIDGRLARRVVRAPQYAISFEAGGREIAIADPLQRIVEEFLTAQSRPPSSRMALLEVQRLRAMETLVAAYPNNRTCTT